ncbi:AraC family transcriptional regulator [Streptomyces sp. RFCAC02]|uniref:AraC family transcriptional regulator n=1 Tax=Streptomyces sp. RFCAC02 TaxID=2499143 RepID=UPI00102140D7|nr:AraC family transcriptional regulator [Streptomyces sp. RFCAC02]
MEIEHLPGAALGSLLDGPRARGAFLMRAVLRPPWCVAVRDEAPLTVISVVRGSACVHPQGAGGVEPLTAGELALVRGPAPYTVADDPATEPQATIRPGGCSVAADGTDLCEEMDLGVRTWGNTPDGDGPTVLLIGTYRLRGDLTGRLRDALPRVLPLRRHAFDSPLPALLDAEIRRDAPGQEVVLDRLLDLLVIEALRTWYASPGADAPPGAHAHSDPAVARALRLLHDHPAHPWTVAGLAAKAGVSRAALARRFTALVGEPPMTYLTGRRLGMAADLLREPDATLDSVARRVGYGSGFALSTAFKRERGVRPSEHRAQGLSPTEGVPPGPHAVSGSLRVS